MRAEIKAVEIVSVSKVFDTRFTNRLNFLSLLFGKKKRFSLDKNVTHSRNFFNALDNISLELSQKNSLGIVGVNGAGKSTLLQIIAGTLRASGGTVRIKGRVASLLELGSGFDPNFTGRENVVLNATILGLSKSEIETRMGKILNFAEIGNFIDQPVKTYSSGMVLRLAFSVIAHVDADILIIDEALAVGDAVFIQKCMRYIREFKKKGSLILVSHDIAAIQSLCNECIWLSGGKLISRGNTDSVTKEYLSHILLKRNATLEKKITAPSSSNREKEMNFELSSGLTKIKSVIFLNQSTLEETSFFNGAEHVILEIRVEVGQMIRSPVVGFILRNRLGQDLFSENTIGSPHQIEPFFTRKKDLIAKFTFQMPILKKGSYSLSVAIAEMNENSECIHHHWLHDALIINSHNENEFNGLVGIPMKSKSLSLEN